MYLTLNIGTKEIRLLVTDKKEVVHWSSKELLPGWVKDGHILEPQAVGAAIESLLKSANVRQDEVALCVTGLPFTHRVVKLPPMKNSLVRDSIKHFMSKESSMPTDQMSLSWAMTDENDNEVTYFVLCVDKKIVDTVAETMKEARIRRWTMDLTSLALARASSKDNAIVVSAEPDYYEIVLVNNGDISTIHTMSIEEEISDSKKQAKQLASEISKAVAYDAKKHKQSLLAQDIPLLLTGEISGDSDFRDLFQTELGYPVTLLTPPLAQETDLPVQLYSTNIGLALKHIMNGDLQQGEAVLYNDIDLDIMSGRYAVARKPFSFVSVLLPLVLAIIAGIVIPMYSASAWQDTELLRLENELAAANKQLEQAIHNNEMAKQIANRTNQVYSRIDDLKRGRQALFGEQGELVAKLEKVVDALPAESYFTNFTMSPEAIALSGHADDVFQVVDYTNVLTREKIASEIRITSITEADAEGDASGGVNFDLVINQ
jgi:Tfp pilus assembly protein PilN